MLKLLTRYDPRKYIVDRDRANSKTHAEQYTRIAMSFEKKGRYGGDTGEVHYYSHIIKYGVVSMLK